MISLTSIPNLLTIFRIILVPFFIFSFYSQLFYLKILSLFIFFVGSVTDFFDGYLARKYNLITNFGKFVDPLADKILVLSAFFILHSLYKDYIPLWMVFLILVRDVVITVFRIYLSKKNTILKTSALAKRKTLFQIIVIHVLLIFHVFYPTNDSTSVVGFGQLFFILMSMTGVLTLACFIINPVLKRLVNNSKD